MMKNNSSRNHVLLGSLNVSKTVILLFSCLVVSFLMVYMACYNINLGNVLLSFRFSTLTYGSGNLDSRTPHLGEQVKEEYYYELRKALKEVSTKDNTVILAFLNKAWAAPNSTLDLFLESFRIGNNTAWLLNHILFIAMDGHAHFRCQALGLHCYLLNTSQSSQFSSQANFMTSTYLDMIWARLGFCHVILSFGYNFIVTDTDIMWLRDPYSYLNHDYDIQTSCDAYNGRELDLNNALNVGFMLVRSNNRTIEFYKFWISSRRNYPKLHEQDVFNRIKRGTIIKYLGLRVRFLDTDHFGGFCSPSRDLNKVFTMHANCCIGLDKKIADLKTTLEDWETYLATYTTTQKDHSQTSHWRVPHKCHM